MSAHYRSPINYSNIQLESASDRVFYIYEVLLSLEITLFVFDVCFSFHTVCTLHLLGIFLLDVLNWAYFFIVSLYMLCGRILKVSCVCRHYMNVKAF